MSVGSLTMFLMRMRKLLSEKTVSEFVLTNLYLMTLKEMTELEGDRGALRKLFEWGYSMGHGYLLRLENDIKGRFRVDPDGIAYIGKGSWYLFCGSDPEISVEKVGLAGRLVIVFTLRDSDCPWCKGLSHSVPMCAYVTGAYEAASNVFSLMASEGDYYAISRETKCKATGNPFCEITTLFIPKQIPREAVVEKFSELFTDFDMEFSRRLYEETFA